MKFNRLSTDGRELLRLSIPALGALAAAPLYVLADTAVVGRHLGTSALGGLGVAAATLLFGYGLCIFLAYGTTAYVARLTGAGNHQQAVSQAVQGLWLALGIGLGMVAIGVPLADQIVGALGATGEVANHASTYLEISLLGAPGLLLMLAGTGYFRGIKDNVRPLQVAVGTALLNLTVEIILIVGFNYGLGASALATVIAQWTGASCYLIWIGREVRLQDVSLWPHPEAIRRIIAISGPLFFRNLLLTSVGLAGTSAATRIGRIEVAAHQVAFEIWMTMALIMDAIAIAAMAMVGDRLGAGDPESARRIGRRAISWSIGMGLIIAPVLVLSRSEIAQIFSNDPEVVALTTFLLVHVGLMAPLGGVAFALDGILIGAGDQAFLAKAMAVAATVTVTAMTTARFLDLGIGWLWVTIWILILLRSALSVIRFIGTSWQVVGADS